MEEEQEKRDQTNTTYPSWSLSTRGVASLFIAIADLTGIRRQFQEPSRRHDRAERNSEEGFCQTQPLVGGSWESSENPEMDTYMETFTQESEKLSVDRVENVQPQTFKNQMMKQVFGRDNEVADVVTDNTGLAEHHVDAHNKDGQNVTVNVYQINNSKGVVLGQGKPTGDTTQTALGRAIEKTQQLLQLSAKETFIPTRTMAAAKKSLVDLGVVIITGRSGDGKTALCLRMLKDVAEDKSRIPLIISTPDEWKLIPPCRQICKIPKEQKYVVFIDDIFGHTNLSVDDLRMWEREFAAMWPLVESGQVLLIVASRGSILKQCQYNIKGFKMFSSAKEFALNTPRYGLRFEEKMCIMEAYLKQRKAFKMSHKDMCEAVRISGELGFPQICKFYISSREAQKRGLDFFRRPLQYLMDEIKYLRDMDPQAYVVLLLAFNKGSLDQSELDPFSPKSHHIKEQLDLLKTVWNVQSGFGLGDVWHVADRLCNIYLSLIQTCFTFSHRSIYETVVLEFTLKYPRKGIEIAPVDILVEFIWTEECQLEGPVLLQEEYYNDLARRILDELRSKDAEKILDHPSLKHERFLKCVFGNISDKDRQDFLSKTVPSTYTDIKHYSVFSDEYIVETFKHNRSGQYQSVNTEQMPLPIQELTLVSLIYIKGHHSLSSELPKYVEESCKTELGKLLASSAFVGDTQLVERLLDKGLIPDETCILAALMCSKDNETTATRIVNHPESPALTPEQIHFCLKFAVHCKKPMTIRLLMDNLSDSQFKRTLIETAMKLLFLDLVSTPGPFSPVLNLPKITTEDEQEATLDMFKILLSAHAPWDPDKSLLLVSQTDNLPLLQNVILELSVRNKSNFQKHDLQTDSSDANVSFESADGTGRQSAHGINQTDKFGCTPLHNAAYCGTAASLELLLGHGANVNATNNIKEAPLHEAAKSKIDCGKKLNLLLAAGATIDAKDVGSRTPVHDLAMKGRSEDFEFLVHKGANIDITDSLGQTPLHIASFVFTAESCEKIKVLIERKADINATDNYGCTPLIYIAEKGTADIFAYLLENGADVNIRTKTGKTALHKAAASSTDSLIKMKLLLKRHCSLEETDEDGRTALLCAAETGGAESLQFLVDTNCNISAINNQGQTALHLVSQSPFANRVKLKCLIKGGIDVNAADILEGSSSLHYASGDGAASIVEFLLEKKACVNLQDHLGLTPLHRAAQSLVDPEVKIQLLIERGADVNMRDKKGNSPILHAAKFGTIEGLRTLVAVHADLFVKGHRGQTVLHKAVQKYQTTTDKVEYLLQMAADVNAVDDLGNTPLHFAALEATFSTLKCLVDNGASVDVPNNLCNTPLHNGVKSSIDSKEKIMYLVECGASIYNKDINNDTALHFAADDTFEKLQLLVAVLGADISQTDVQDNTLLYRVAMSPTDIKSKILLLLEHGSDINARGKSGWNLSHWAVNHGSGKDLQMLLEMGANPTVADDNGLLLIHKAATSKTDCLLKLKLLVDNGVPVDAVDGKGSTPLHAAADRGTRDSVDFLVKHGADVSLKNRDGQTALHLAVTSQFESYEKILVLVESGADVNVEDNNHTTPLLLAANTTSLQTLEYLNSHGSGMNN